MKIWVLISLMVSLFAHAGADLSKPYTIKPGVYGYGTETRAAYGKPSVEPIILHVDTLSGEKINTDATHGSFLWAIHRSFPRIIVFDVGGLIDIGSDTGKFQIFSPYVSIHGQTAPTPIALRGELFIRAGDVFVEHIAVRGYGTSEAGSMDAISVSSNAGKIIRGVVIDHCSASWSTDELISVTSGQDNLELVQDVTVSNCLGAEGADRAHDTGSIVQGKRLSYHDNYFAHVGHRFPSFNFGVDISYTNNLIYNHYSQVAIAYGANEIGRLGSPSYLTWVGNQIVYGPNSTTDNNSVHNRILRLAQNFWDNKIFIYFNDIIKGGELVITMPTLEDVYYPENNGTNGKPVIRTTAAQRANLQQMQSPHYPSNYKPFAATLLFDNIIKNVGSRPAERDEMDARQINFLKTRSGKVLDSPDEIVMPTYHEASSPFIIVDEPHQMANQYYTNLEVQLHQLADKVEGKSMKYSQIVPILYMLDK